ncbi:acylneuraminate cytidylyltransferase family protein [Salinibius halmophilus]|uniref:acylneuraminate cytidylyltransferase family protein n=1 Tax=Salinibius halmophilus TaxID=1853216 RepID=UPI0018F41611|nr:acylneuraminate cytidylyltransferase family protein [Salinibius halmophilus]
MVKKRIAIIPARGGSKRIPLKNIATFCNKPMIAWTIEAANRSGLFDRVLVSTDSEEIATVAKEWGAETPFHRNNYADSHSPVSLATIAALQQAMEYWEEDYDSVTQLMPNCPLRDANSIIAAVESFEQFDREFQISCFKYGWMNPWWAAKLDENQRPEKLFPEAVTKRSQDLPELFCPTGAIWIAKTKPLFSEQTFYGANHVFEPLSWEAAVDIDDYDDLFFAEVVKKMKSQKKMSS